MPEPRRSARLPRQFDPAVPHLSSLKMMTAIQFPVLPQVVDWTAKLPAGNLGMMLNQDLGDCTVAALYHGVQVWTGNALGQTYTEPDSCVLDAYEEKCGYHPDDPSSDRGGDEQPVLAWATNTGMLMSDGSRSKLAAFVEVDPRNMTDVCEAIYECG